MKVSERDLISERRLLAHILIMAIEDLCDPQHQVDAEAFLNSPGLELLADGLGLTAWRVRLRAAQGFDPVEVHELTKYVRRARKGKNGGVVLERARSLADVRGGA